MNEIYCERCDSTDCWCDKCSECGSKDLTYYDDGDGYPPNILCEDCGHWD